MNKPRVSTYTKRSSKEQRPQKQPGSLGVGAASLWKPRVFASLCLPSQGFTCSSIFRRVTDLSAPNWLLRKAPGAGKDWRQEEKGTRDWFDRCEFEQALGVDDGWEAGHAAVRGGTTSRTDRVTELNWHFIRGGSRVLFSRPEGKGFTQ